MYDFGYNPLTDDGPSPEEIEEMKASIRAKWSPKERASRCAGSEIGNVRWSPPSVPMRDIFGASECASYARVT